MADPVLDSPPGHAAFPVQVEGIESEPSPTRGRRRVLWALALVVLLGITVPAPQRGIDGIDRVLRTVRPILVPLALVLVLGWTLLNAARDFGPQWFYKRGWAAFSAMAC